MAPTDPIIDEGAAQLKDMTAKGLYFSFHGDRMVFSDTPILYSVIIEKDRQE